MKKLSLVLVTISLLLSSCKFTKIETDDDRDEMEKLEIPKSFDFSTEKNVTINLNSISKKNSSFTKYDLYIYDDKMDTETVNYTDEDGADIEQEIVISNVLNNKISSKVLANGESLDLNFNIPSYVNKLYLVKNNLGVYSHEVINVTAKKNNHYSYESIAEDPVDMLYGVNSGGDLFTINPVSGDLTIIAQLPSDMPGSVTCAYDEINRKLYTIGSKKPNKLYSFDVDNSTFEYKGDVGMGGPRLEYRKEDGLLYFSTSNKVYQVNPENADVIATYTVNGLHNSGWGDVAFTDDGILYMATYSGLYHLEPGDNNTYEATRISADDLPFNPTSMTFDTNQELWLGTIKDGKGRTVIMDKITGGWEYRFDPFDIRINDLTTLPLDESQVIEKDTDGDGIIDFYDEYPDDGEKASNTYTPSIYGWGTLAFEDLWPQKGDYDFNDLVINYRITTILNANNMAVEMKWNFNIKNIGGSFKNGFGIELPTNPNVIESVSGQRLNLGIVSLSANGTETNQDNAVIMVLDNAWDNNSNRDIEIIISLVNPISEIDLGLANFNPFIFINGDRSREVHLADKSPTNLADMSYFGTAYDDSNPSTNRYYKSETNLPWAIDIMHDFVYPVEKQAIIKGYVNFGAWAESGGTLHDSWYKNQDGNRNNQFLEN